MEELRREFAEAARKSSNFSAVCREFEITRATGYKWLKRYEGQEPLSDRSRCPNVTANKTPETIELQIIALRTEHPGWGARKIKVALENKGFEIPCEKTVNNILNRYHCISKEESYTKETFKRAAAENGTEEMFHRPLFPSTGICRPVTVTKFRKQRKRDVRMVVAREEQKVRFACYST